MPDEYIEAHASNADFKYFEVKDSILFEEDMGSLNTRHSQYDHHVPLRVVNLLSNHSSNSMLVMYDRETISGIIIFKCIC